MITLGTLKKASAVYGATVEQDSPGVYQVVAPAGQWWRESSGPHLRVDFTDAAGDVCPAMREEAIQDALNRMTSGLEPEGEE